jgi:hypothetical protein
MDILTIFNLTNSIIGKPMLSASKSTIQIVKNQTEVVV